jgi:hypothetical protein
MAARGHTIRLQPDAYELLAREATRRGLEPDALADELLRTDLSAAPEADLEEVLAGLADVRAGLPPIDAVALVREGRRELEARGS